MSSSNDISTHKVATIVSLILSMYGNLRYLVGRSPFDHKSPFHVDETPFTANIIVTFVYWILLYILQVSFVVQIFVPNVDAAVRVDATRNVGWHFTVFNAMSFLWSILFAKKHFFWSELVLILNFFNILTLYFGHKTYSIKPITNWVLIHLSTAALPLSWLMFAIFWNGAVLFHVHKFVGRVIANVLIWDFLLVPGMFLLAYNDWGVGLSSSVLVFGLALGQLFTKLFALQWIFAFVIAGILFVGSLIAAVTGSLTPQRPVTGESAPLIE